MDAPKYTKIKSNCGAAGRAQTSMVGIDPDVAAQVSCMSGEISSIESLNFQFEYKTRLNYEPFAGRASVALKDVSLSYQFRPYSELHKHRFSDDPD